MTRPGHGPISSSQSRQLSPFPPGYLGVESVHHSLQMHSSKQQRGLSLILVLIAVFLILFASRLPEDGNSIANTSVFSKNIRDPPRELAGINIPVPFGRRDESIRVNHIGSRSAEEGKAAKISKRTLTL